MTNSLIPFGDPAQFEIAARWSSDPEVRERLPLTEGWSTGELRITVCGQVLTAHRLHGEAHDSLSWYLSPVVDWLIRNWTWLLHEERYAWHDKYGQPAAVATLSALDRALSAADQGEGTYPAVHAWWARHALRATDASAVYPDIYIRRLADDIEISWLSRQPEFAPNGFSLMLAPGCVLLPVHAVAQPLWQFLEWATQTAPAATGADRQYIAKLATRFSALCATPLSQLEQAYVGEYVESMLVEARTQTHNASHSVLSEGIPAIESLDSAVLMFGGLNVDLGKADFDRLLGFLSQQGGGADARVLAEMVQTPESDAWLPPYEEGYRLAEECREALGIAPNQLRVDMVAVLAKLQIPVREEALDTATIRGVAVAGQAYAPAILVNTRSVFNSNDVGRRFTLAHELCHILYDRTRARKLSHLSGPWASARTEKRANAFAAMFLAPPSAIRRRLCAVTPDAVRSLARDVGMGTTALVEHLYNVDLISDAEREALRQG